jgi:HK97 family phage portal protein
MARQGLKAFTINRTQSAPPVSRSLFTPYFVDPDNTDLWDNSAVGSCISTAMDAIIEAPLYLYELVGTDEDGEPIWEKRPEHPISKLLANPNPFYTSAELRQATLLSRMVDGNGYNIIIENGYRQPVELWYEPHYAIEPYWNPGDVKSYIDYYARSVVSGNRRMPVENVIHFRAGLDPRNTRKGLSSLKAFARGVKADDEIDILAYSLVRRKGIAGLVVMPKSDLDEFGEDIREEMEERVSSKIAGGKQGGTLVMSRPVELVQPNFSPKDMDTTGMGRRSEERISGLLNTPAILAGLGAGLDRSTFSNMEEAQRYYSERFLVPAWMREGEVYSRVLVPRFGLDPSKFRVMADTTKVKALQDNREQLHKIADGSFNAGWLDRAGAKKIVKQKPLPEDKGVFKVAPATADQVAADKLKKELSETYRDRRQMFEAMATEFDADAEETH